MVRQSHITFSEVIEPDLSWARWTRDFVLLGGGIGGLAPCVLLGPMAWGSRANEPILLFLLFACCVLGAMLGLIVGPSLRTLASWGRARPFLLAFLGFPVGMAAGFTVGAPIGQIIGHEEAIVPLLGMVTGGLVLGLGWLPYLALKLRGRSGLPVVALGVLASPIMGAAAVATVVLLGG